MDEIKAGQAEHIDIQLLTADIILSVTTGLNHKELIYRYLKNSKSVPHGTLLETINGTLLEHFFIIHSAFNRYI